MTHFYLIRHATNDWVGHAIAGWSPHVHLNAEGRKQAEQLAMRLDRIQFQQLYCSPLDRAQETAAPLAKRLGLEVRTAPEIGEIQFGLWNGKTIAELENDPGWRIWNHSRSTARAPQGESMLEVQVRIVRFFERLVVEFPQQAIAVVSHGDPIRAALMYYLGMHLDQVHRLEVSPASVSRLDIGPDGGQVVSMNVV